MRRLRVAAPAAECGLAEAESLDHYAQAAVNRRVQLAQFLKSIVSRQFGGSNRRDRPEFDRVIVRAANKTPAIRRKG
jgi:hypothetical protein